MSRFYLAIGGRNNVVGSPLPTSIYDTKTHQWKNVVPLGRFRHSSWIHNYKLFAFGGFENTNPTICVGKFVELDLKEELIPTITKNKDKTNNEKSKIKSDKEEHSMFKFSSFAHIAMSYSPNIPKEIQHNISMIPFDK